MARQAREASAADVRQWALDTNWTDSGGNAVGERGRFSSELVEAFNRAHRRNNIVYGGGSTGGSTAGRSTAVATRPASRSSDSGPSTRRAPGNSPQRQAAAPATRQRAAHGGGDVVAAMVLPAGTGLTENQMRDYNRMLADANAVTGTQMELTIVRLAPAAVA